YGLLAVVTVVTALVCWWRLKETPQEPAVATDQRAESVFRLVALIAFLTFLEVGIENTTTTWLASYVVRVADIGAARAAALSSFYWCGFLLSRGLSSIVLLRIEPMRVLYAMAAAALLAACLLLGVAGSMGTGFAML